MARPSVRGSRSCFLVGVLTLSLLPGCDLSKEVDGFWAWSRGLLGLAGQGPQPTPSASPAAEGAPTSDLARRSKENAELLAEIHQVLYIRDPREPRSEGERGEFGSMVDSMNQGASLEGIYNGYAHSSEYRKLEVEHRGASPEALKIFAAELAVLEAELPEATVFDERSARPLATPVQPSLEGEGPAEGASATAPGVEVVEFKGKTAAGGPQPFEKAQPTAPPKPTLDQLQALYERQFVGASIYTLKRVIGDEAQKVIAAKKASPQSLALWYSKWVLRLLASRGAQGVSFGVALRSKPDEEFHYKWAMAISPDRLLWEVLNRLNRMLNEANPLKQ